MGCSAISQAVSLDCCCVTPPYIGLGGGLGHGWEPLCDPSLFGPVDPWRFADPSLLADCWRLVSVAAQNHWLLRRICRPIVRPAVGLLQGETRKGAYKPFRVLAYIAASYDVPGFFFFNKHPGKPCDEWRSSQVLLCCFDSHIYTLSLVCTDGDFEQELIAHSPLRRPLRCFAF